jgi:excisionase family DNA binding protein
MGLDSPSPEPMATWRTLDDAAAQLKIGRRTLTQWISDGKIKAYTIAGDRRRWVDLDEIKELRTPKPIERPPPKP